MILLLVWATFSNQFAKEVKARPPLLNAWSRHAHPCARPLLPFWHHRPPTLRPACTSPQVDAGSIIAVTLLNLAVYFIFLAFSLLMPITPPFQWILVRTVKRHPFQ